MPASRQSLTITDAYQGAVSKLAEHAKDQVRRNWEQLDFHKLRSTYGPVHVSAVLNVQQAQRNAVNLTGGYFAAYLSSELGKRVPVPNVKTADYVGKSYEGDDVAGALMTPLVKVFNAQKEGQPDPLGSGLKVMLANVDLDVKHAARATLADLMAGDDRVVGWRRVTAGTCPACAGLADNSVLPPGTPLKVHPHCRCVSEAVVKGVPGKVSRPTGQSKFERLSLAQLLDVMNEAVARALYSGQLKLVDLVDEVGGFISVRPLSELSVANGSKAEPVELKDFDPNQPRDEHGRWVRILAVPGPGFIPWEGTPGTEPGPRFKPRPTPRTAHEAWEQHPREPVLFISDAYNSIGKLKPGGTFTGPEGSVVERRTDGKFRIDGPTGVHVTANLTDASARMWREEREAQARRFGNTIPGNPLGKLPGVDVESEKRVGDAIGGMLHGGWIKLPGGTRVHRKPGEHGAGDTFEIFATDGRTASVPATDKAAAAAAANEFEGKASSKSSSATPHMVSGYTEARLGLHRASAQVLGVVQQPSNEIALRVDPRDGSFGTPAFVDTDGKVTRYAVLDDHLVREKDGFIDAADPIPGVDAAAASQVGDVLKIGERALEQLKTESRPGEDTTTPTLWPEHFDLAIEHGLGPGGRANVGVSPGDVDHPEPYFYVGPWGPVEGPLWNGDTFNGAMLPWAEVFNEAVDDPLKTVLDFYRSRLNALREKGQNASAKGKRLDWHNAPLSKELFVETEHPRDLRGRFSDKPGIGPLEPVSAAEPSGSPRLTRSDLPNPDLVNKEYAAKLKERQDKSSAFEAKERGMTPEEFRDSETKRVKELTDPSTARIVVRVTRGNLATILRQGRFKTQHENHRSKGLLDPGLRLKVEQDEFGVPDDAPLEMRPVYGYVTDQDEDVYRAGGFLMQYGDAVVVMKQNVRDRTTVTSDDSLDSYGAPGQIPMPIDDADWRIGLYRSNVGWEESLHPTGSLGFGPESEKFWGGINLPVSEHFPGKLSDSTNYMEAQVQGGVKLEDIDHVEFGTEPEVKLKKLLEKKGVPYVVKDEGKRRAALKQIERIYYDERSIAESEQRIKDLKAGEKLSDMEMSRFDDKTGKLVDLTEAEARQHQIEQSEDYILSNYDEVTRAKHQKAEIDSLYDQGNAPPFVDVKSMGTKKLRDWNIELIMRKVAGESVDALLAEADEEGGGRGKRDYEGMGVVVPGDGPSAQRTWDEAVRAQYEKLTQEGVKLPKLEDMRGDLFYGVGWQHDRRSVLDDERKERRAILTPVGELSDSALRAAVRAGGARAVQAKAELKRRGKK